MKKRFVKWESNMSRSLRFGLVVCVLLTVGLPSQQAEAQPEPELSKGQTLYLPVYSQLFVGTGQIPLNMSANVSVRNTDPANPITVLSADYYDTEGTLVKKYLDKRIELKPMGSSYVYIKTADKTNGRGATFIIKWKSKAPVNQPIAECLMSGTSGTHAFTYSTRGQPIKDTTK